MEWSRYAELVSQYDALLDYGRDVSSALVGLKPAETRLAYAENIYVKVLGHALTLRALSPDPERKKPSEFWDLSSAAAVARCIIDGQEAFTYIALGTVDPLDQEFRILLWQVHDTLRRLKMGEAIGAKGAQFQAIQDAATARKQLLVEHPYYPRTSSKFQADLRGGDLQPFHISRRERCEAAGMSLNFMNAAHMQLSQYVHTLPMSIHQLRGFRAGSPSALSLMALPLHYAPVFLNRIVVGMLDLFPGHVPEPPTELRKMMRLWGILGKRGGRPVGD